MLNFTFYVCAENFYIIYQPVLVPPHSTQEVLIPLGMLVYALFSSLGIHLSYLNLAPIECAFDLYLALITYMFHLHVASTSGGYHANIICYCLLGAKFGDPQLVDSGPVAKATDTQHQLTMLHN